MNRSPLIVVLATVLLTGTVWAQETDPAQEIREQYAAEQAAREARQARLDVLMGTMAEEMQALDKVKSRKEREAVMTTHRKHMSEAMSLMRGMGGTRMREVMGEHMASGMGRKMSSEPSRPNSRSRSRFWRSASKQSAVCRSRRGPPGLTVCSWSFTPHHRPFI